ncbi:labd-13Z-ene-9,15,16-triol synthase, chloroplastic-like [Primulina huaijiensis]|uniref:labd-13Z-ene-9,15,16-triol synthase, chloroplastic-like n=1 Tax=Primulina huaijiensis TaxID=1492673 RepID=UPI003CC754AD
MDDFSLPILTAFLIIVSIFWYFFISKTSKKETHPIPPGPRGLPFLGYLPFLQVNLHKQFTELANKYGPVYKLWLGSKLCVVISSPSLIKEVVRDHDTIFANRDPPVAAIVATGGVDIVWSPYGQYWRDMRKLFVREMLSNSNLEASYVHRKDEVRKVVKSLHMKTGSAVEISELIFVTELNVVFSMLWGGTMDKKIIDRIGSEFREAMSKLVDLLGKPNVSDFFPVLAKFDVQGIEKEAKSLIPSIDEILDSVINERMKTMVSGKGRDERRKDFLQILLELKEQDDPDRSINLPQIKAILKDIIAGGTDTTATIIEWVMAEVLNDPQVKKRVQDELTEVVGLKNTVEESHLPGLHYLNAIIKESFRLHPPVPLLVPRLPSQSSIIGGYTIPKGSRVFLNMWSIHRDPLVWENPSEFKPDRFLNDSGNFDFSGNNFQYLPFGSGRRVCPGILLAERMVMHLLATLFHLFDWELPEGSEKIDLSENFGIVMRKRTPLIAIPYPRLHDSEIYA